MVLRWGTYLWRLAGGLPMMRECRCCLISRWVGVEDLGCSMLVVGGAGGEGKKRVAQLEDIVIQRARIVSREAIR